MINKDFFYLFHVAENLLPDIDLEELNFILTWFLFLYFSSSQLFCWVFFSSIQRDKLKKLMPNFVIFQNLVCHLQMKYHGLFLQDAFTALAALLKQLGLSFLLLVPSVHFVLVTFLKDLLCP